ncbi:MAG: site-specific integrase, partial [Pseudomonadota bacterium]
TRAAEFREIARNGGDPAQERVRQAGRVITFETVARQTWAEKVDGVSKNEKASRQWLTKLETYAFPMIGSRPVAEISTSDVAEVLRPVWRSKPEVGKKMRQHMNMTFGFAKAKGWVSNNPVADVGDALPRQDATTRHYRALSWREVPALMRRLEATDGAGAVALRLAILTACRSGEIRGAMWSEFDRDQGLWEIPSERMKMARAHRVPITPSVAAVLAEIPHVGELLFESPRIPGKPVSDMTLLAVLRRLRVDATVHGFRSSFRDFAAEHGADHRVAELSLAHTVRGVEGAYQRSDLLDRRRALMNEWDRFLAGDSP